MLKIGLTGGIGCGKSTVSALFAELGIPVIDADQIAKDSVKPGQPALASIQKEFGGQVINVDGSLNRAMLGDIIFSDAVAKQRLEAIIHPRVYQAMRTRLAELNASYAVVSVPLLFETGMEALVDRVLVIDCPVEIQIERVKKRDSLTDARIKSIIASQISREARMARADDLLDNSGVFDSLAEQVKTLHNLYLSLSIHQD